MPPPPLWKGWKVCPSGCKSFYFLKAPQIIEAIIFNIIISLNANANYLNLNPPIHLWWLAQCESQDQIQVYSVLFPAFQYSIHLNIKLTGLLKVSVFFKSFFLHDHLLILYSFLNIFIQFLTKKFNANYPFFHI